MSDLKSTPSVSASATAGEMKNYSRPGAVPRPYATRGAAESVAAHYATLHFFARRGTPYAYECATCRAFHCGLDTGRVWHGDRWSHDCWTEFIGIHPDAAESDAA